MALLLIKHRPAQASPVVLPQPQPLSAVVVSPLFQSALPQPLLSLAPLLLPLQPLLLLSLAKPQPPLRAGKTCEGSTTAPERKGVAKVRLRKGPMGEPHKAVRRLDLAVLPEAIQQALLRPPEAESSDEEGPSLRPVKTAAKGLVSAEAQQQHPSGS